MAGETNLPRNENSVFKAATIFGFIVSSFFGVGGAFYLDRRIRSSSQKEKARAILSSLKAELNRNLGILTQIQKTLKPTMTIFF